MQRGRRPGGDVFSEGTGRCARSAHDSVRLVIRAGIGQELSAEGQPVPTYPLAQASGYFINWLSLKIGRMMLIAMKPTRPPITTIISGSIIAVTLLMTDLSSRA